jgi:hypothetical protein
MVLHGWLKEALAAIITTLSARPAISRRANRKLWESWQEGLAVRITLPQELPPFRMLLVRDNLAGHKTPEMVLWMFSHGIMP